MKNSSAVIFGGTGFIGAFFGRYLLDWGLVGRVYLLDIEDASRKASEFRRRLIGRDPRIVFVQGDVREDLGWFSPSEPVSIAANFAAVHREPGHEDWEYYQTNLRGADNVCDWAEKVGCNCIIFTSSISPYGVSDVQARATIARRSSVCTHCV